MALAAGTIMNCAFIVLALALVMSAAAPVAKAQTCTTGSGSPTFADANTCVNYIRNKVGTQCCQTSSSGCTTMCFAGTAATDICGQRGHCEPCETAGASLNQVLAKCVQSVGGVSRVSGSLVDTGVATYTIPPFLADGSWNGTSL